MLAAARIAGVDRVFTHRRRAGGRRARLRHGDRSRASTRSSAPATPTSPSAKRRVFGTVGIDMIAGPSRDPGASPTARRRADWVAMDLFSQAEHDELAQSILLCPDARLHRRGRRRASTGCCPTMPRADDHRARRSTDRGALIQTRDMDEACAISQPHRARAPRARRAETRSAGPPLIRHAGAIFLGALHREALGDYCAGPNHVLPTARHARFSSPLGVYDFQKRTQRDRSVARRRAGARARSPPNWPTAKACRRTRARREMRMANEARQSWSAPEVARA